MAVFGFSAFSLSFSLQGSLKALSWVQGAAPQQLRGSQSWSLTVTLSLETPRPMIATSSGLQSNMSS